MALVLGTLLLGVGCGGEQGLNPVRYEDYADPQGRFTLQYPETWDLTSADNGEVMVARTTPSAHDEGYPADLGLITVSFAAAAPTGMTAEQARAWVGSTFPQDFEGGSYNEISGELVSTDGHPMWKATFAGIDAFASDRRVEAHYHFLPDSTVRVWAHINDAPTIGEELEAEASEILQRFRWEATP